MNTLSKFSLAVFGGVSVLMLAVPADAATNRVKFRASVDEIRRYCEKIDKDFWHTKRSYGCGKVGCVSGNCTAELRKLPPPPPPPPLYARESGGKGGGEGGNANAGGDRGGGNDSGSSSSAGGPN